MGIQFRMSTAIFAIALMVTENTGLPMRLAPVLLATVWACDVRAGASAFAHLAAPCHVAARIGAIL